MCVVFNNSVCLHFKKVKHHSKWWFIWSNHWWSNGPMVSSVTVMLRNPVQHHSCKAHSACQSHGQSLSLDGWQWKNVKNKWPTMMEKLFELNTKRWCIYIYNHGWKIKDCFYFLEFFFRIWSSTGVGEVFEISDPLGPWATPTWPPHFGSIKRGNSQFAFRFPCWGIHSHLVQVDLEDWPIWLTFLRFEGTEYRLSPEEGMAVFF